MAARPVALVLAAGRSVRMGEPKQLLPWNGRTLLAHVVDRIGAMGFAPLVVTTAAVYGRAGLDPALPVVLNPHPEAGLSQSLVLGLARWAADHPASAGPDWVAVFLGDQPLLQPAVVEAVRAAFLARPAGIHVVRPRIGGVPAHPSLLDHEAVQHTLADPPQGDRGLGHAVGLGLQWVDLDAAVWARHRLDIDTPEDYRRALAAASAEPPAAGAG